MFKFNIFRAENRLGSRFDWIGEVRANDSVTAREMAKLQFYCPPSHFIYVEMDNEEYVDEARESDYVEG